MSDGLKKTTIKSHGHGKPSINFNSLSILQTFSEQSMSHYSPSNLFARARLI